MWLAKFVERASDVFHHYVLLSITYKRAGSRRCKRSGSVNFRKGETNVNSLKGKVAVSTDPMYVILGASGNTGSIIADFLLSKGKKVVSPVRVRARAGRADGCCFCSIANAAAKSFFACRPPPNSLPRNASLIES